MRHRSRRDLRALVPAVTLPIWIVGAAVFAGLGLGPSQARAARGKQLDPESGLVDPRKRWPPRRHRFRIGVQLDYLRLSAAQDQETGETQRFHYLPFQVDFAYQLQFLKFMMVRPSLALGPNLANTLEAMPFIVHPQLYMGYQGSTLGVAVGYGWFNPFPARPDVISAVRGGLGQPVITNNHQIGGEISVTSRIDHGALSFIFRVSGVRSHLRHFDLDRPKSWRVMPSINLGWYFGDGRRSAARKREREQQRRES